jgi:hypothetical protein
VQRRRKLVRHPVEGDQKGSHTDEQQNAMQIDNRPNDTRRASG